MKINNELFKINDILSKQSMATENIYCDPIKSIIKQQQIIVDTINHDISDSIAKITQPALKNIYSNTTVCTKKVINNNYISAIDSLKEQQPLIKNITAAIPKSPLTNSNLAAVKIYDTEKELLSRYKVTDPITCAIKEGSQNYTTLITKEIPVTSALKIDLPSDRAIAKLNSAINNLTSVSDILDKSLVSADISLLSNIDFGCVPLDIELPKDISVHSMRKVINSSVQELNDFQFDNDDFDNETFENEIRFLDFNNDLNQLMPHITNCLIMADNCIDQSIKQKFYEAIVNGIIELIGQGFALIAVFLLYVFINHILQNYMVYQHFIEICKKAKDKFKM